MHIRERSIPEADISKNLADRTAKAFHVLLQVVEPRRINFRRSQSPYGGGHFREGHDHLYFKIEEELVDKPETGNQQRSYYAAGHGDKVPCGWLTFTFKTERYGSSKPRIWTENEKTPLEKILAEMAKFICGHYVEAQKRREAEAIESEKRRVESERRHQEYLREEAVRREKEAEEKHARSLESVGQHRRNDLAKAAEWWRLHQSASDLILECERRWLNTQEGGLTAEQKGWLEWARGTIEALSPFEAGYPDPAVDGGFDSAKVPFGGPYAATRKFPQPPSMPEIPAPVVIKQGYEAASSYQVPPPQPFPFWLKYPRR